MYVVCVHTDTLSLSIGQRSFIPAIRTTEQTRKNSWCYFMLHRRKRVSRSWSKVQVHRLSLAHEHQLSMVRATRVRLPYGSTQTEDEEPWTWMVRRSLNSSMYMNFLPGVEIDPERPRDDPATTPRRSR